MGFTPSKVPLSFYDLALTLGSQWLTQKATTPKRNKPVKPEKTRYILFYTDGEFLYEFPLVCLYGNHIMHPFQFKANLEQAVTPPGFTFISARHPLVAELRQTYYVRIIRNSHEASRISTPSRHNACESL